jgi:hypothetical protein
MSHVFKYHYIEYSDKHQIYLALPQIDENADSLKW